MKKHILCFVKFFDEEWKADNFIKGNLYCNRLSYFKKLENDEHRGDRFEALAAWWQPNGMKLSIQVNNAAGDLIQTIEIHESDLAAPTSMEFQVHNNFHLFCMYAVCLTDHDEQCQTEEEKESLLNRLRAEVKIDERCFEFGKYVVLFDKKNFLNRVVTYFKENGMGLNARLVEYYDDEKFSGEIPIKDILFKKQIKFNYQSEYRFAFNTNTIGDEAKTIHVGDMSDFCYKTTPELINTLIKIDMKD